MNAEVARISSVAVVGAGVVGSSLALAAARLGDVEVRVTDRDASVRRRARELGVAEVVDDLPNAVAGVDLVVAAVPTAAVAEVLVAAAAHAPAGAIVSDAGSLKADLTLEVESRLRSRPGAEGPIRPVRYVGGHPMAGSERSGPEAADAHLFQGATWVLTPTASTDDAALSELSAFLRRLGARVVALSPARHDELVAVISHLPQVVASTLAAVAADAAEVAGDTVLTLAGGGFRDTTRIAASDTGLWLPILAGNRAAVLEALVAYRARLGSLEDAIRGEDWATVQATFERGHAARQHLSAKDAPTRLADVVVPLDDRPGQLATATTALGEAGINVEDLAMRHAAAGLRGALIVRVAGSDQDRAVEVLREAGLTAHLEPDDAGVDQEGQR